MNSFFRFQCRHFARTRLLAARHPAQRPSGWTQDDTAKSFCNPGARIRKLKDISKYLFFMLKRIPCRRPSEDGIETGEFFSHKVEPVFPPRGGVTLCRNLDTYRRALILGLAAALAIRTASV